MARDTQKYTRWTNEPDEEDLGLNEEVHVEEPLNIEDDQERMQEGRRVLAMMTPNSSEEKTVFTKPAFARLLLALVLGSVLFVCFGALAGYVISNKAYNTKLRINQDSLVCPPASPTSTTTARSQTTTIPTTRIPAPESVEETGFDHLGDISTMATQIQSFLTVDLIQRYIEKISTVEPYRLKDFIEETLTSFDFSVEERVFPVMTSSPDRENLNTIEVLSSSGNSTRIINNATQSLNMSYPFSGFSASGSVTGPILIANFALDEDFANMEMESVNTSVNGSILLVKLCKIHPSVQVRNAEARGAIGVIFYPNSVDFGNDFHSKPYPEGSALPSDGVIWESLRVFPGDPSTPNYASQRNTFRIPQEKYASMPSIPVQPVSGKTGLLLENLALDNSNRPLPGVPKKDPTIVRLTVNNFISEDSTHAFVAFPPAQDHSRVVLVGCHYEVRDDIRLTSSGLGLASIMALADALHSAYPNGTTRLLALAVFEGKDGDFSAGNEFSQLFSWWLESRAMAYIDMDELLEGSGYMNAFVSPILRETLREAFRHVAWVEGEALDVTQGLIKALPNRFSSSERNKTSKYLETFSYKNPFECDESVNFVNVHGIPTIQLTAVSLDKDKRFFLRNSQYDTVEALISQEDKDLKWTHMVVSALSVAALTLSSAVLPPVLFHEVGRDLSNAWRTFYDEKQDVFLNSRSSVRDLTDSLSRAFDSFVLTCESYDTVYSEGLNVDDGLTPYQRFRKVEDRLQQFTEFGRRFLRPRNIRHPSSFGSYLIYGPSLEDPCEGTYFPEVKRALREALADRGSWDTVLEELSLLLTTLAEIRTDS